MKALFTVIFAVCSVACSNQNPSDVAGTDANVDVINDVINDVAEDAPQDGGTDTGKTGCNTLSNIGTVIPQTYVATDPVAGDGGAIASGTYVLTAAAVYTGADGGTGPTGTTLVDTLAIVAMAGSGSYERVLSVVDDAGADGSASRQNGAYTVDGGPGIRVKQTCPAGAQPFTTYDSNGTKFRIYAPSAGPGNPGLMFEYTKQ